MSSFHINKLACQFYGCWQKTRSSLAKERHHSWQSRQHALHGCISSSCLLSSTRMMPSGLGRDCAHNGFLSQLRNSKAFFQFSSVQFSPVAQLCPALCDPMNCSTPVLPVHHQLPEFTQTHIHQVGDAIQPSHPLSSPFPPAPNPSQHQPYSLMCTTHLTFIFPK